MMGLYNFDPRFVPKIRSGEKKHTIRGYRRYPDKPGNTLHLYIGLRTRSVELIGRATCARVQDIEIRTDLAIDDDDTGDRWELVRVFIDGEQLSTDECEALAQRDGFASFGEMIEFWRGRLPFEGQIVHWQNLEAA